MKYIQKWLANYRRIIQINQKLIQANIILTYQLTLFKSLSEMSHFVLNNQILQGFQTEIDKINLKIEIWIKKQWVFVFAYKDMVQNYADSRQLIDQDQYLVASDKEVLSKRLYNKLMPNLCKQNLKRKERMFWEDDRSFKCQRSIQNIQIPSADKWDLNLLMKMKQRLARFWLWVQR